MVERRNYQQLTTSTPDLPRRREEIAALIARLMGHYWTADDHPATRRAQAEDWLDDLIEFTAENVAAACREWRQSYNRRPTPHDIRGLCIRQQTRRAEQSPYPALPAPERPRRKQMLNCWEPVYAERYREQWFLDLPIETQRRYKEQDLARLDAWNAIHNARSDDDHGLAMAAYAALCMDQMKANLGAVKRYSEDARHAWQDDSAIRDDAAALGLSAPKKDFA
jgi:hypothetical protein